MRLVTVEEEIDIEETELCLLNLREAELNGEVTAEQAEEYRQILLEHKETL